MMSCHPERSAQRGVEGSRAASASALFDLHCHLDFDPDVRVAAQELAELDMGAFSTTVTPEGYEWACELLEPFGNVRVGLGLHPWWIADGRLGSQDVALFERLAKDERFIGEVGLDFGRDRAATRDMQVAAFERVARACASGGKVLSIHAVKAAGEALDVLERAGALVETPASSIGSRARPMSCSAPSAPAASSRSIRACWRRSAAVPTPRPSRPSASCWKPTPRPSRASATMRPPKPLGSPPCSKPSPTCVARPATTLPLVSRGPAASFCASFSSRPVNGAPTSAAPAARDRRLLL